MNLTPLPIDQGYYHKPWICDYNYRDIAAYAASVSQTTTVDIPFALLAQNAQPHKAVAFVRAGIRRSQAFTTACTVSIVNQAGTQLAGNGCLIDDSGEWLPLVAVALAANTPMQEVFVRVTLGSGNFAGQTAGAFRVAMWFDELPMNN